MKKYLSKLLIASIFITAFTFINVKPVNAAASLYLSPSSSTVVQGSTLTVSIRTNTGGVAVNAVQANLTYPSDKFDLLWISSGGSAFEITAEESGGGGSIKIGRGTISAKSGDQFVASVTFSAKVSTGSASISFSGGSSVVSSSTSKNILGASSGGFYSFTEPAPASAPKPKDKTAPKISDVSIAKLSRDSATITWKTNEKATSTVNWGPTEKFGISSGNTKLVESHSVSLDKRLLAPGATIHYQVSSKDAEGNVGKSETKSFITPGFTVEIKVVDESDNPVEGAKVTIVSVGETSTDDQGLATFKDVPGGDQVVIVEIEGKEKTKVINVEDKDANQTFDVKIAGSFSATKLIGGKDSSVAVVLILLILFAITVLVFRKNPLKFRNIFKDKK